MTRLIIYFGLTFLIMSCKDTQTLYVANHLVDCEGLAPQQCLLIKENVNDEWTYFYDHIKGFDYEQGYNYMLEVVVSKIENPPADGSSLQYTLVKVLSKEKNQPLGQHPISSTPASQENLSKIIYEASTRGAYFKVIIDKEFIQRTKDRRTTQLDSKACSSNDWKTLSTTIRTIDLRALDKLVSPTDKRTTDAALHATLKIITTSQTYTSKSFDHGNPPEEIKPLVNTILSLAESIE